MAWPQHVLLLWLVLCVAGQADMSSKMLYSVYTLAGKGRCVLPVLAQHTTSLVSCAALCSSTVTCGAFSVGLQGAARGDWAWRTCELVTVTSKETLFNDDPSYRCYVNYNQSIFSASVTTTSRAINTSLFTTTTTRSPQLNTTFRYNTTVRSNTTEARFTTVTTSSPRYKKPW